MVHALPLCASAQRLADLEQHTLASLANLIATVQGNAFTPQCGKWPLPTCTGYDCVEIVVWPYARCLAHDGTRPQFPGIQGKYKELSDCQKTGCA